MFAFAHVFPVHLECQRPDCPEAQRILVVQADDMTPARAPVAQHLPHRVEHAQRAELAQREQVKAAPPPPVSTPPVTQGTHPDEPAVARTDHSA